MSCSEKIEDHSYDFFDNINDYMKDGNSVEDTVISAQASTGCVSFANFLAKRLGSFENAKNICELFTKLYNYLPSLKENRTGDMNYKKDWALLNYLLNVKLNGYKIKGNICVSHFDNYIESYCSDMFGYGGYKLDYLYDIKEDELNKMNILFSLYENYSKLNAIKNTNPEQNKEVSTLSTACCADYIKVSYLCNGEYKKNNLKFCDKLNTFISKHDALYTEVVARDPKYSDYFIKLEECPNNKIITTAVTGTVVGLIPLLGVLYKFTPMGQMFRPKTGILNNISNNDEEMIKMSLMEQENEPLKFQQGTYNIKYQSL
ncbi:VIR protein [Plasmodium vivax]|uniref:VIR protein n=1 Tax=Plasmodium vivax TaxID=5855 RepID=A0A1G4EAQ8_PLAVI|nr:VIR protein [Plasmodium vivax]VUZ95033.1 PIR protein [Plasmodium vivax]